MDLRTGSSGMIFNSCFNLNSIKVTGKKLIVVDDDDSIRDIIQLILERAGYEVKLYANGEDMLRENLDLPDAYILDKELPGMDGLAICRQLRNDSETKYIPVLIVSAATNLESLSKMAGATDFLEKPFSTRELLEKIDYALAAIV